MHSPCYQFWSYDQTQFNWLTRVVDKDGEEGVRFRCVGVFCPKCGAFDEDSVFATGWEHTFVRIRPRKGRNMLRTNDNFFCVNESLLRPLLKAGVKGFEHKSLPGSAWHVLRITNRRQFDPTIYRTPEPACDVCKRVAHYGGARFEREIELPEEKLAFFSTDKPRGQGGYDLFVTDNLRSLLVELGANGGELHRLLTDEEEKLERENPKWRPVGALVRLGEHRHTVSD